VPGLLSRLLARSSPRRPASLETVEATLYPGDDPLEVVGESRYQDALWKIVGGRRGDPVRYETEAVLEPEPDNPYDPNAIKVLIEGAVVGYLSREDAATFRPGLLELMEASATARVALEASIVGGGPRAGGIGFLGVFLDHNPADFGLAREGPVSARGVRTGFSEAMATDHADDSYDLSWYEELSENHIKAIEQLRFKLATERDPIDRHYMLCELEKRLYKSRDAFASALEEFDDVCRQHDEEMATIRPELLDKFGVIPVIDMYRQAAVRWQKAKSWQAMRDWAQRGISVYGEHAARPEAVEDLQKRLGYAVTKINAAGRPKQRKPRGATVMTRSPAGSEVAVLVCASCGTTFERVRTRGRKPRLCPACRGAAGPAASS
jgi:rubrerythrin